MESKERFLPVLQITNENVDKMFPLLKSALFNSSFIAIDVEMTGLGDTKLLFNQEVDQRYKYMREMTKTLSTVSVGISCFRHNGCSSHEYNVQTFDILVLSEAPHQVQAGSLKFLRGHGFDFNRQIDHGLSYTPGNDPQEEELSKNAKKKKKKFDCVEEPLVAKKGVRDIFSLIVQANKPLVLHNGFVDITFFYEHFYAELPSQLDTLVADLCAMFPKGIYDTKYLSEFVHRVPATYLQFVYIYELIKNAETSKDASRIVLQFPVSCSQTLSSLPCVSYFRYQRGLNNEIDSKENLCNSFAYHGWCRNGDSCVDSHCLSRIVSELSNKQSVTKRKAHAAFGATGTNLILESYMKSNGIHRINSQPKRKKMSVSPDKTTNNIEEVMDVLNGVECITNGFTSADQNRLEETKNNHNLRDAKDSKNCEGHSSGFDAFMTGFIFASHIAYENSSLGGCNEFIAQDLGMEDHVNKVYLMCKNMPLLIKRSAYSTVSSSSSAKLKVLRSEICNS